MNFIIFAFIALLGANGLFWFEDKVKKEGNPIPQPIAILGVIWVCLFAFVISIII